MKTLIAAVLVLCSAAVQAQRGGLPCFDREASEWRMFLNEGTVLIFRGDIGKVGGPKTRVYMAPDGDWVIMRSPTEDHDDSAICLYGSGKAGELTEGWVPEGEPPRKPKPKLFKPKAGQLGV